MPDNLHPSKRPESPHFRLRLAIVLLSVVAVMNNIRVMNDASSIAMGLFVILTNILITCYGVYFSRELQWLWGGILLFCGLLRVGMDVLKGSQSGMPPIWDDLVLPFMLGSGYLLIIDPQVRRYRRALRDYGRSIKWRQMDLDRRREAEL